MTNLLQIIIKPAYADIVGIINPGGGIPTDILQTTPFISTIVRLLVIVAGLFTFWQFLVGGLGMITGGGDKGKITEAQGKITMAITGLVVITASFLIIGIVSQVLFGDFTRILNPKLETVTTP